MEKVKCQTYLTPLGTEVQINTICKTRHVAEYVFVIKIEDELNAICINQQGTETMRKLGALLPIQVIITSNKPFEYPVQGGVYFGGDDDRCIRYAFNNNREDTAKNIVAAFPDLHNVKDSPAEDEIIPSLTIEDAIIFMRSNCPAIVEVEQEQQGHPDDYSKPHGIFIKIDKNNCIKLATGMIFSPCETNVKLKGFNLSEEEIEKQKCLKDCYHFGKAHLPTHFSECNCCENLSHYHKLGAKVTENNNNKSVSSFIGWFKERVTLKPFEEDYLKFIMNELANCEKQKVLEALEAHMINDLETWTTLPKKALSNFKESLK